MNSHPTFRPTLVFAALAFGLCGAAFAQSSADNPAATTSVTTQTTTTVTAPASPSAATDVAAAAAATATPAASTQSSIELNAAIGSTSLTRADSANEAFQKLDTRSTGFLSRSDVAQLPGFGDAFAKADRDADGRLDRTEFSDAWSYYVDQGASGAVTTTTTTTIGAMPSPAPTQ